MFYEISWTFQKWKIQEKIQLLLNSESEKYIRDFLKIYGIAVFSLKEFQWNKEDFGKIEFKVPYWEQKILWVAPYDKIRDAYYFLADVWFDIVYINNISNPIEEEKVSKIITKLYKEVFGLSSKEQEKQDQKKQKTEDEEKKIKEFKQLINTTIEEARELMSNVKWIVTPNKLKDLNDLIDEMIKVKMWKNVDKMAHMFENILLQMEKIEIEYLNKKRKEESSWIKYSVLSELDVLFEYDKYKRSKKVFKWSSVSAMNKTFDDYYYKTFGKSGVYMKLFLKDFYFRLKKFKKNIPFIIDLFEFFFLLLILELVGLYLYNLFLGKEVVSVYYYFWNVWILGFLFYVFRAFSKSNFVFLFISLFCVLIWFFIIRTFIIVNFGF